jgi:hypothetical protein
MLLKVSLNTITLILPPSATFITNLNPGSTTSAAIRLNLLQQSTWISINCLCTLKKNLVGYFGSLTFNNWSSNSLLSSELFYFNLFSDNNQNRLNKQENNIHYKNIIFNQLIAITAVVHILSLESITFMPCLLICSMMKNTFCVNFISFHSILELISQWWKRHCVFISHVRDKLGRLKITFLIGRV